MKQLFPGKYFSIFSPHWANRLIEEIGILFIFELHLQFTEIIVTNFPWYIYQYSLVKNDFQNLKRLVIYQANVVLC